MSNAAITATVQHDAQRFNDTELRAEVLQRKAPAIVYRTFSCDGDANDSTYVVSPVCAPAWTMESFDSLEDAEALCAHHGLPCEPLPDHAMLVLKVQHSAMAPEAAQASPLWSLDRAKGWSYLTPEGTDLYEQIQRAHPDLVFAHNAVTSAAIRASHKAQLETLFN